MLLLSWLQAAGITVIACTMTSGGQCRQRIISKEVRVNCNGCKRYIHDRCLVRFLGSTKKQECCNRNLAHSVNSTAGGGPVLPRISDQNSSRTALFDSARHFDLHNSFLSTGSAIHDLTMQHNINSLGGSSSNFHYLCGYLWRVSITCLKYKWTIAFWISRVVFSLLVLL